MRFQQKTVWVRSALTAVSVSQRSPSLAIRGYRRGTITALNLLAPVQSCFSKLLAAGTLRIDTHPKSLPASSAPHRARYFSQTLSNVRGRLRPTIEEVSAVASSEITLSAAETYSTQGYAG